MLQVQIKNGQNMVFVSEIYKKQKTIDEVKKLIDDAIESRSCVCIELKDINGNHCYIPKTVFSNNIVMLCEE